MAYVVTENCIACKYTDCVEVCPVDCFYEGADTLVINPDECIDCGVCEPECPADAIKPDTDPNMEQWLAFNRKYAHIWSVITQRKEPLTDAALHNGNSQKLARYYPQDMTVGEGQDTCSLILGLTGRLD